MYANVKNDNFYNNFLIHGNKNVLKINILW